MGCKCFSTHVARARSSTLAFSMPLGAVTSITAHGPGRRLCRGRKREVRVEGRVKQESAGTVGVTALGMPGRGGRLAPAGQSLLLIVGGNAR